MATTTNYIQDLASMRQFIRSLTFGNHNRGKVNARGIKGSQHDDIIRRLDYFGIIPHMYTQRIGKASIPHRPCVLCGKWTGAVSVKRRNYVDRDGRI